MGLKADGTAVLLLHWARKSGGEVGDSGLGSTSLAGTVDAILQLTGIDGGDSSRHRKLSATSRHSDVPEDIVIDLTEDGYVLVGEGKDAIRASTTDVIMDLLADGQPYTEKMLATALAGSCSRSTVGNALTWLAERDLILRNPGRRGGPNGSVPATYCRTGIVTRGAKVESKGNPHIHPDTFAMDEGASKGNEQTSSEIPLLLMIAMVRCRSDGHHATSTVDGCSDHRTGRQRFLRI